MDKNDAIKISQGYLQKVRTIGFGLTEAWIFGSFAKGTNNENSDIDIALVLGVHGEHTFETEVKLMTIRSKGETIIEPHVFTIDEFDSNLPIVRQIKQYGEKLEV
jgi:uncharacterized protein